MPRIDRDLIGALGFGPEVIEMATKKMMNSRQIVDALVENPDFKDAIGKLGGNVRIYPTDVAKFLSADLARKTAILGENLGSDAENAMAVQTAKERVMATIRLGEEWGALARKSIELLSVEMETYEEVKNCGDQELARLARFPAAAFEQTRKAVLADLQFLRALKSDQQVQGILKAQTVNLNQGMSQEDFWDILYLVGEQLGKDRTAVTTAYTKALIARKRARHAGRVQADVVSEVPPMPAFTQALERSSGIVPADA